MSSSSPSFSSPNFVNRNSKRSEKEDKVCTKGSYNFTLDSIQDKGNAETEKLKLMLA